MDRHFRIIINPVAGPGDNIRFWHRLNGYLTKHNLNIKVKFTKEKGHATRITSKRIEKGKEEVIVSVGGDGTFNEVASVLVGNGRTIAHVPRGSGNGLARMLRIPRKPCRIPGYLKNGQPKSIDVGKVNDSYFFCTFGFGFDALIAHRFAESKSRGLKTYVLEVLRAFIGYKGVEARFLADGEEYSGKFFSVTLSNANQFGNNAFIAPFADLQDGLLDLTVIRPFPKIAAPLIGLALFGKFIHLMPFTEIRKVKTVEIFSAAELRFHRDGDACVPDFPVQVSVLPDALSVLVPGH